MLTITPIPAFSDNYIWTLYDRTRGDGAVVVDPGDAAPVEAFLKEQSLRLSAILITHHHADHTGGIAALNEGREIPVYGPAAESIAGVTHSLREGDSVAQSDVFDAPLRVIEVPGHTRGHIAYVGDGVVFCGDTLFAAGCGRLFEGTPAQMHASLAKLAALPDETNAYCTHEYTLSNLRFASAVEPNNPILQQRVFDESEKRARDEPTVPMTIAIEKATNPFLRTHVPEVIERANSFHGRPLENGVDVFAVIREWKNNFR